MRHAFTEAFRTALAGWRTRRARDRAVRRALALFGATHPTWTASCFDAAFVHRIGVDAVLAGPAVEVARSWTLQFRYTDERTRARDVRQLVPVVEAFTALLREALAAPAAATAPMGARRRRRSVTAGRPRSLPCADGLASDGCA
jgi:hypothetical protein